jgi:molybdate transport system ATP-binding protein
VSDAALRVRLRQVSPIALDLDVSVGAADLLAIFGPSGSGKSTILRSIAGLYRPADARIDVAGQTWVDTGAGLDLPAHQRHVGLVFQDYALFPHLTAVQNVEMALLHWPRPERRRRAEALMARVHLAGLERRRPHALSGGERQRVALARALGREPRALLLDEPFAAVDRATRQRLRSEVDAVRRSLQVPTVLVTHDVEDVVRLATHLLVIEKGQAVAYGALADLLSRPDLPALRASIGLGSLIEAEIDSVDASRGLVVLRFNGGTLIAPHRGERPGDAVRLRIPAREVILSDRLPVGLSLHNAVPCVVSAVSAQADAPFVTVQLSVGATRLLAEVTRDAVERLDVRPGRAIFALIKSVSLEF